MRGATCGSGQTTADSRQPPTRPTNRRNQCANATNAPMQLMQPMNQFHIREATPEDSAALQGIQARSPQGTGLRFTTVNKPDFFARARVYHRPRVFVAEQEGILLGSAASGLREVTLAGETHRAGYEFQYFVDPAHRRKGVASALHRHIEAVLRSEGASFSYLLTAEDNLPSMRLFEKEGFTLYRTLRAPFLLPYKKMVAPGQGAVRPAVPEDLPAIAKLLNETWNGFVLYKPYTAESLQESLACLHGFSLENLFVLERNGGNLTACVGYWDWRKITEITVQALNTRLKIIRAALNLAGLMTSAPSLPGPGETLTQWCLTPVGFSSPEALRAVLVSINNRAVAERVGQLFLVGERRSHWFSALRGFFTADTLTHLYVKPLVDAFSLPSDAPVFLDAVDL